MRRRDLDPFDRRGKGDSLNVGDVPLLFGRLVRRGRGGALLTLAIGGCLAAAGGFGTWVTGPWNSVIYPFGLCASVVALALGLWGIGLGFWSVLKPHPLAEIPDVRTFVEQMATTAHPVTVCTRCRRLLEVVTTKRCDRCLSGADLFTARSQADHRVIFATLPKEP